jgi:putative redox protein
MRAQEDDMAVEIDVEYLGDLHCRALHGPSQSTLTTDARVDNGGKGELFSPTDLVATGLGSCMLTVIGLVARRKQLDIGGARVHVTKEMTSSGTRRIGRLTAVITLPPTLALSPENRALIEKAAHACPVRQSLHPDVAVEIRFA